MSEKTLHIREMTVGAEVVGLTVGDERDPEMGRQLYQAWLEYGFLLFRNVSSIEHHLSLSRCFGGLEIHPIPDVRSALHPELIDIGGKTRARAYVFDDGLIRINRNAWHRDTAFTPDICKGAMLRMVNASPTEGETMMADTARAYGDLPDDVKARIEKLEYKASLRSNPMRQTRPGAFWKTARPATDEEDPEFSRLGGRSIRDDLYPSVVHPVVITHPESRLKCLFISPTYVDFFIGLEPGESEQLHRYLADHMTKEKYVYKHRWAADEALVWDNRRVLHAACGNPVGEFRYGHRTTLADPMRTGRYFDQNETGQNLRKLVD